MTTDQAVTFRPSSARGLGVLAGLAGAGAAAAVLLAVRAGVLPPDRPAAALVPVLALVLTATALGALHGAVARVRGDADGLHVRTLLRRRSTAWADVAYFYVRRYDHRRGTTLRLGVALQDGRTRLLPMPYGAALRDERFEARAEALRALHRRHGAPTAEHRPAVVSHRTAGAGGWVLLWLGLCVLLLGGSFAVAGTVSGTAVHERAWQSAAACPDDDEPAGAGGGPAADCLTTVSAVVERAVEEGRHRGRLHFADDRPTADAAVTEDAARAFRPGDTVLVTVWRGRPMVVAGEHHVWRAHVPGTSAQAVVSGVLLLLAGYPGARLLQHLRGRRLRPEEVLPSVLPFVGALLGTAAWLLPLCYVHPTDPLGPPEAVAWAGMGTLATLGLLAAAWRATRVREPRDDVAGPHGEDAAAQHEVFLPARFLDETAYNPHGFGTHVVIGGGEPAVVPHPGPGRFAARRIPADRLTLEGVRRARGEDGDGVPRDWHIAELDDGGAPVRLAASPGNLARILGALGTVPGGTAHPAGAPGTAHAPGPPPPA
ncbi:PH domain-containing protein [Streptomyces sp. NPDC006984]|uniref:PH domain-containing protein n=1 Tax=Streptomyces sp. NPDC006984 TaxID=3155463 RepID=UPI003403FBCA